MKQLQAMNKNVESDAEDIVTKKPGMNMAIMLQKNVQKKPGMNTANSAAENKSYN